MNMHIISKLSEHDGGAEAKSQGKRLLGGEFAAAGNEKVEDYKLNDDGVHESIFTEETKTLQLFPSGGEEKRTEAVQKKWPDD